MSLVNNSELYQVDPGSVLDLATHFPHDSSAFSGPKDEGKELLDQLNDELEELQELLYAEGKHKVLIVLQGLDTSGKDGVIRHVFDGANPQGVRVKSYKAPTEQELAHHFLWRVWPHAPGSGMISIFNRSHYEDILVPVVEGYIDNDEHAERVGAINAFERSLFHDRTLILKFFLHISKAEQIERFRARLEKPHKQWKFNPGDLETHAKWDSYMAAYQRAISETSTEYAPWHVIPSDRKWYRNLVIGSVIVESLHALNMSYPPLEYDPTTIQLPNVEDEEIPH